MEVEHEDPGRNESRVSKGRVRFSPCSFAHSSEVADPPLRSSLSETLEFLVIEVCQGEERVQNVRFASEAIADHFL